MIKNYICESIDRCGKDTLIKGILNKLGYKLVLHRSKPEVLNAYKDKGNALYLYQQTCFIQDMALLKATEEFNFSVIFNRSWIGEAIFANLYRKYDGNYVFNLEKTMGIDRLKQTRLILLREDFEHSSHFVSDGLSFDDTKREEEQELFIQAFDRSILPDKRIITVTDKTTGKFRSQEAILEEALA